jgi:hypothetical protein
MLSSKKQQKWHHLCTLCNVIIKVIINVDYHDVNLSDILMVHKKAAINFQHFTLLTVLAANGDINDDDYVDCL